LIKEAVKDVLVTPSYKLGAERLQREIAAVDSLERASEIVESILPQR
jgi:UDP:flavonoid glycosyltransferase YjiC (YdhE family)